MNSLLKVMSTHCIVDLQEPRLVQCLAKCYAWIGELVYCDVNGVIKVFMTMKAGFHCHKICHILHSLDE